MIICNKKIKNCVFDNEHTHWRYSLHNLIVYRDLIVYTTAHLVLLQSDCVVEQFTSCQNNEGWEDGSCDEIRPEMDKSFNQGGFWLTQMCQMIWCSRKAPKDWQTGVILPMDRKETERNATTTEAFLSLAFLEKAFGKYFEKRCREKIEEKLEDKYCGFSRGRSVCVQQNYSGRQRNNQRLPETVRYFETRACFPSAPPKRKSRC